MPQVGRSHHYVPQFYLRNFSTDTDRKKINTVRKIGSRAIWTERSIKEVGQERDLYVSDLDGLPICHEDRIGQGIENPLTQTDTWRKIQENASSDIDRTDKPVIYSLIRHFEARNPHYFSIFEELGALAFNKPEQFPFSDEERAHFIESYVNHKLAKETFNAMSSSLDWTARGYRGAGLTIARSPLRLKSSTTPVLALPALPHPRLGPLLPGMIPFQYVLTLNPFTLATLVLGDFNDAFLNIEIDADTARGFNRQYVAYFAKFPKVEHLISDRDGLIEEMTWAPFRLISESAASIKFERMESPN